MTTSRRARAALLAAVLLGPAVALAGDGEAGVADLAGLLNEPVVSTASKTAETAGLAPAMASVVSAEDLRRHGIDSLAQAIDFLALGMLTEPSWATPEIGARGVLLSGDYGNHVLLLVDGHAMNEPWDGTAYYDLSAAIPLDLVDHIEVILGPGSVLYGSSAMLGVINVITRRAKDYAGVHALAEGAVPVGGHAAIGYGGESTWLGRPVELTAALDYAGTRGPRQGYGVQTYDGQPWGGVARHRALDVPSAYLRLLAGDLEVSARAALARRAATQIWGSFDDPRNWERDRWLSLDVRYGVSLSPSLQANLHLYGDLYDYLAHEPSAAGADCLDGQASCVILNSGVSRWGGAELSGTWDWLTDGRFVTLIGADLRYREVRSWTDYDDPTAGTSTRVMPYDQGGFTLGAYLQQTLRPAGWLSLNAGVRLDRDPQLGSHVSPRLAAVASTWTGGTVKAIYSEAFRAPTFYERYYADPLTWLAAPGLRPETVRSVEGVVEQRVGADRFRLGAFRTWWSDLVLTVPATQADIDAGIAGGALDPGATLGAVFTYANASHVNSYGLNADWDGSGLGQRLHYGAGVTLARSRRTGGDASRLAAAAQVFGNARVSYDLGGRLPVAALAARVVGPRPLSGTGFTDAPDAKTQVELRAALSGPLGGGVSWRLAGDWALTRGSAYAVGPLRAPEPGYDAQAVLPLPRWQALAGIRIDR